MISPSSRCQFFFAGDWGPASQPQPLINGGEEERGLGAFVRREKKKNEREKKKHRGSTDPRQTRGSSIKNRPVIKAAGEALLLIIIGP